MEDKVIEHFSHEHPLFLKENRVNDLETLTCYGCGDPVASYEPTYVCMQKGCWDLILHKRCGELPSEIPHPKHPQHPLQLRYTAAGGWCDLCSRDLGDGFRYVCRSCNFDIDITCTIISIDALLEERELQHQCHPHHHLTLMRKRAFSFRCDGCGAEDVDMAYICSSCEFWIHKSCASLPLMLPTNCHHHQLSLAFSFPKEHRYADFRYKCEVCEKDFDTTCWVYFCADCRFFAHIKCVTSTTTVEQHSNSDEDENGGSNVIQFPLHAHDIMEELITPFVMRATGVDNILHVKDMPTTVTMPQTKASYSFLFNYHNHPLSLVPAENHNIVEYEDEEDEDESETSESDHEPKICDVCITPIISPPYYECFECKYFVHSVCYFLPKTLSSPSSSSADSLLYGGGCPITHDKTHKFTLYTSSELTDTDLELYKCDLCKLATNGMVYECEGCKMKIDVKCASLPSRIKHAAHPQHKALVMTRLSPGSCHVCSNKFEVAGYYCGNEDCDFALDLKCVMLPSSIRNHEWDKHPLLLSYDACLDHPSDFMCELCEEELHPKKWMYHCRQCDSSFHLFCPKIGSGWYRNIKFGRRFVLDGIHTHALTLNWVTLQKRCSICRYDVYDYCGLECASCYYVVCISCAVDILLKICR